MKTPPLARDESLICCVVCIAAVAASDAARKAQEEEARTATHQTTHTGSRRAAERYRRAACLCCRTAMSAGAAAVAAAHARRQNRERRARLRDDDNDSLQSTPRGGSALSSPDAPSPQQPIASFREAVLALRQQKELQQQMAEGGASSTKGTPLRPKGDEGTASAEPGDTPGGEPPLTYPPGSPVMSGGSKNEDPIKKIQEMIHESHYELTRDIERMMVDHENALRSRIKAVLRQHAASVVDLRNSPLDQMRPQPQQDSS